MTDLFQAAAKAARPASKPATGFAALKPSGRFEKHGKAALFVHWCAKCGDLEAPFGFLCSIGAAMDTGDASRAGIWLCEECRDVVLAEEEAAGRAN